MRCTVLLFAQMAEAIQADRLEIELDEGATVRDALDGLARNHEAIAAMAGCLAVAVNERYSPASTTLNNGDTIALIPPVSGD